MSLFLIMSLLNLVNGLQRSVFMTKGIIRMLLFANQGIWRECVLKCDFVLN